MFKSLKWLVVPGGPGLSNIYLKHSLPRIFHNFDLRFYEPYGAPGSKNPTPTIKEMVEQLEEVASDNNEDFGLITHSFGNYLACRMLARNNSHLRAIIMLNPIPFTAKSWKKSLEQLTNQVPISILEKVNDLSQNLDDGAELFRLIYPFYVDNKARPLPVDVPFSISACNAISQQVEFFDEYPLIASSNVLMIRIVGEKDVFYTDTETMRDNTYVLSGTGHYPFFEDPDQFLTIMPNVEKKLCQMTPKMTTKFF